MRLSKKVLIAIALFALMFSSFTYSALGFAKTPRNQTVWGTGYGTWGLRLNPYDGSPQWSCGFMYESVFAFNGVFQTLIPAIGTDMSWSADGRTLTINLDPTAKWSDGSSITPEDVKYSFELAAAQTRWSGMDDWESITTGTNQVIFHQMANTTFSYGLFTRLTTDVPVVKKSVWTDICRYVNNDTAPAGGVTDLATFDNYWFGKLENETAFPDAWKVISGPYTVISMDDLTKEEVLQYRENWWGANHLYITGDGIKIPNYAGVPKAKYLTHRVNNDNPAKIAEFEQGSIDFFAGGVVDMAPIMADHPNVQTWYGRDTTKFFLPLSAPIGLVFNLKWYPFSEVAFRKAVSNLFNYDDISQTNSLGIWSRANIGGLDPNNPSHLPYINMTIYNNEPRVPNLTTATSLMETFAYKADDGFWYTTEATGHVIYKTHLLAVPGNDEDAVHDGINVKLDDIPILCPTGWSDVAGATDDWAIAMTAFGLGAARDNGAFDAVWQPKIKNLEYDAIMQCCEAAMFQDPYATLAGYRGDGNRPWANSSGWTGPAAFMSHRME